MKWDEKPLREVLEKDLDCVPVTPGTQYEMTGVLSYGKGLFRKPAASGETSSYSTFYKLQRNQLVMSQLFGWEGALAVVTEPFVGTHVSSQFPTFQVKPKEAEIGYIGWAVRQPSFWTQLAAKAVGMGVRRKTLNPEALLSCKLPIPPVDEQRRVVAKLDAAAERIACATTAQSANAEDFDRLLISMHETAAKGRVCTVGSILELSEEQEYISPEKEYPQVGVKCFGGGLFTKGPVLGGSTTYKTFNRLYPGTVVLSQVKGWEGAIGVADPSLDGWFVSPEYRTFRCRDGQADPDYLSKILKFHRRSPGSAGEALKV
jgi:type I restriction enzyme S subunit